ncbi:hypothetical protein [Collinsella aerofaciens]|uniref:hypothetical protein n=2 Tax=Collinsella aerofaciens TaxID=74426 RepID=UPI0034A23F32
MPPLPMELQSSCDALYIYECQQAGLSINDLEKLSYRQVQTLLDMYSFVNDAIAYAQDDEESRKGEAVFWA